MALRRSANWTETPKLRHSDKAHFAGKEAASGKEEGQGIQPGVSAFGRGAHEEMGEHPGAVTGTGRTAQAAAQVAGSTGSRVWRGRR